MTNDDQSGQDASAEAARPGGLNHDHDEQGGVEPVQAPAGLPAQGAAARGGHADSPASTDATEQRRPKKARSFWRELPVLVVLALALALAIKTFVAQAFFIPSSSMENTLKIRDKVLVNKLVYHFRAIAPGDIIVFDGEGSWVPAPSPSSTGSNPIARLYDATLGPLLHSVAGLFGTAPSQTDFIKRVIGVPGDHVACCTAQGLVTVNGVPLHEKSYLYPGNAPGSAPSGTETFSITVPPGRLWVMGDHRSVSEDSRLRRGDHGGGTIPENKVIGRAIMVVWPPSRWRNLPIPSTFAQPGIDSPSAAAGLGAAAGVSGPVAPAAPYLPVAAGFALALPLTWLQRQLRLRGLRRPGRRARPECAESETGPDAPSLITEDPAGRSVPDPP
jgi:signal peptidase I